MELKKFNEYTEEEKETLLLHVWNYRNHLLTTDKENEMFEELIKHNSQDVFDSIITSFSSGNTVENLIFAMRSGTLAEYFDNVKDQKQDMDFSNEAEVIEREVLRIIVKSYIKRCVKSGVESNTDKIHKWLLTEERVCDIFDICRLQEAEISGPAELYPTVTGEGVNSNCDFNLTRLGENIEAISDMVGELHEIDFVLGEQFNNLNKDRFERIWTTDYDVVDKLVQLGTAAGILEFYFPRENWSKLPGGFPLINRNPAWNKENDLVKIDRQKVKK